MTFFMRLVAIVLWYLALLAMAHAATEAVSAIRWTTGGVSVLLVLAGVACWAGGNPPSADERAERERMRAAAARYLDDERDPSDADGGWR